MLPSIERRPWPRDSRYLVGTDGTVLGPSGRTLTGGIQEDGYQRITIRPPGGLPRFCTTVGVMVCETFHGPRPEGMQAAHENGNPSDCRPENLRWDARVGNMADRIPHGTNGRKLTREDVLAIRERSAAGATRWFLAERYGVTPGTITHIMNGHTWRAA